MFNFGCYFLSTLSLRFYKDSSTLVENRPLHDQCLDPDHTCIYLASGKLYMDAHTHFQELLYFPTYSHKGHFDSPSKTGNIPCKCTNIQVHSLKDFPLDEVVQRAGLRPGWPEGQEFPRRCNRKLWLTEQLLGS
ncbi:p110 5L [African swine fever virus]|uniref:p110 5L n=1 Tax=African swine fever virus TaxID=10497 RepID=A0A894KS48_ASF|nr:p110 5L [African swine fever virus]